MTDEEFKAALTLFAGHVEQKKARGILVDVSRFRHKLGPDVQPWRVKNISNRYAAAGVKRAPGEEFLTGAFDDVQKAEAWLTAG